MKLQPEDKSRDRQKIQIRVVKEYLLFMFSMIGNCVVDGYYNAVARLSSRLFHLLTFLPPHAR
ncbi:MAG: hypothetical protein Q6358_03185 [Candidatus Brocadiales bacterium]|nr:hypothetical protein [Candidatus Brocadiales bacterium]